MLKCYSIRNKGIFGCSIQGCMNYVAVKKHPITKYHLIPQRDHELNHAICFFFLIKNDILGQFSHQCVEVVGFPIALQSKDLGFPKGIDRFLKVIVVLVDSAFLHV